MLRLLSLIPGLFLLFLLPSVVINFRLLYLAFLSVHFYHDTVSNLLPNAKSNSIGRIELRPENQLLQWPLETLH